MLATHLFAKNIRSRITLPYQWLNTVVNVARLNSSSSSDSSSDSDTETESSNQNAGRGSKNIAGLTNNYPPREKRNVDYLQSRHEAYRRRQIQKHIVEAAQTLSFKNVTNKDHIVSRLLNKISNIQNKDTSNAMNKIDEYKSMDDNKYKGRPAKQTYVAENAYQKFGTRYEEQQSNLSKLLLQNEKKKRKNVSNQTTEKDHDVKRGLSTIHTLNVQNKRKHVSNRITEKDHDVERGLSTIHTLNVQNKRKHVSNRITEKDHDVERGLSTIHTLSVQNKRKDVSNKITEKDYDVERGLSTIHTLNVQNKRKDVNNKISERDHDVVRGLSTIHMLRNQEMANINKPKPNYAMEREPSVIRSLKRMPRMETTTMKERRPGTRFEDASNFKDIFNNAFLKCPAVPKFEIWDACEKKELELLVTTYPKNAFEEMINWTKEGKLWKFPIDNEQGLEKEQSIHFSKHVFLEQHLEEWCPNRGPIRHFMELVCVGLSKNPYMTIDEKYDHIMWYKDYFQDKGDLLQQLGLLE